MNRLLIAMVAASLATVASARMPFDSNQPSNEQMQNEVKAATGGPSTGAAAGLKANELAAKSETPPVLQTNEEKQRAVAKATGGPSTGAAAGLAAKRIRDQQAQQSPTPLSSATEKQMAVASATGTHDHGG